MATIKIRKLDSSYDPEFGQGQQDFAEDIDAVAQIVKQMLLLFMGEWWENKKNGIPMFQSILGKGRGDKGRKAVDSIIQNRVLSAPYVTGINSVTSAYDPETRDYTITMTVDTKFGPVTISNA